LRPRRRSLGETGWRILTRSGFHNRFNNLLVAAGRIRLQGHGFRIGGATTLLLGGLPESIMHTRGRWVSRPTAFLRYWCRHMELQAMLAQNATLFPEYDTPDIPLSIPSSEPPR
jgi:hypothetical protein